MNSLPPRTTEYAAAQPEATPMQTEDDLRHDSAVHVAAGGRVAQEPDLRHRLDPGGLVGGVVGVGRGWSVAPIKGKGLA